MEGELLQCRTLRPEGQGCSLEARIDRVLELIHLEIDKALGRFRVKAHGGGALPLLRDVALPL